MFTFFFNKYKNEWKKYNFRRWKDKKKLDRWKKIDEIDVDKILVSEKEPHATKKSIKYSIAYNDDGVIRPLCKSFLKGFAMLNTLTVVRQCLLRLLTISY